MSNKITQLFIFNRVGTNIKYIFKNPKTKKRTVDWDVTPLTYI